MSGLAIRNIREHIAELHTDMLELSALMGIKESIYNTDDLKEVIEKEEVEEQEEVIEEPQKAELPTIELHEEKEPEPIEEEKEPEPIEENKEDEKPKLPTIELHEEEISDKVEDTTEQEEDIVLPNLDDKVDMENIPILSESNTEVEEKHEEESTEETATEEHVEEPIEEHVEEPVTEEVVEEHVTEEQQEEEPMIETVAEEVQEVAVVEEVNNEININQTQEQTNEQTHETTNETTNEPTDEQTEVGAEKIDSTTDDSPVIDFKLSRFYSEELQEKFVPNGMQPKFIAQQYKCSCARCGKSFMALTGKVNDSASMLYVAPKIMPIEHNICEMSGYVLLCPVCHKSRGADGLWETEPKTFLFEYDNLNSELKKNSLIKDGVYEDESNEIIKKCTDRYNAATKDDKDKAIGYFIRTFK